MLEISKKQALDKFIAGFDNNELMWISGYLAGLANSSGAAVLAPQGKWADNLTVIYVTETGNSKFLAGEISKKVKSSGGNIKVKSVDQYRLNDLSKEKNVIFIISTHGDGEMPISGKKFEEFISNDGLDLSKLNYLVIALGDTNYPLFCKAGKDTDLTLTNLKAKRLAAPIELDLDFEDEIESIQDQISAYFQDGASAVSAPKKVKKGKSQYEGEIAANIDLNDIDSTKETRHIEIVLDDDIDYEPGDSIGIVLEKDGEKLTPRLYSIASSVNEHGNEVHLTVSVLRYVNDNGEKIEGVISNYLANLEVGDKIKFYVSKNRQFKLPEDDKDIIMVGPGTGVAPFRSFVAERNYRAASGKNWLFFGERNFKSDFLYQIEWLNYLQDGLLTNLDVAFSRDQKEKLYVQNRLEEKAVEVYKWLENGAYFYVCGDKDNMANDVENALLAIIAKEGGKSQDQAKEYLANLVEQNRYLKDVY